MRNIAQKTLEIMAGFITALTLLVPIGFIYMIPTIIAEKHPNKSGIVILNIFLGWTGIGWVIALIWAVTKK